MGDVLARFEEVTRHFGDLVAVDSASLEIRSGEVLAVLGENGAGKSTLMKLLYGVYPPSGGKIVVKDCPGGIAGPAEALHHGIGMVFQHFSQLPALSVIFRQKRLLLISHLPFESGFLLTQRFFPILRTGHLPVLFRPLLNQYASWESLPAVAAAVLQCHHRPMKKCNRAGLGLLSSVNRHGWLIQMFPGFECFDLPVQQLQAQKILL